MEDLVKLGIIITVVVVVAIAAYMIFGGAFKSPQQICGELGQIYDPVRDICVTAGGLGESCAPIISSGQCQYGLECHWDINPLVGFRSCQGILQFP